MQISKFTKFSIPWKKKCHLMKPPIARLIFPANWSLILTSKLDIELLISSIFSQDPGFTKINIIGITVSKYGKIFFLFKFIRLIS